MEIISGLLILLHISCYCFEYGTALDTITSSKSIKDPESITSNNGVFRFGFFTVVNSTDRYVGIWYTVGTPETSIIWVANRDKPLKDESGVVMVSEDGNLIVLDGQGEILWSTSTVEVSVSNVTATVLDTGNLVLQGNKSDGVSLLWESFQQPCNAFVPTMRISSNVRTGEKLELTSWKSSSDPSNGSFSIGLGTLNIPQVFVWNDGRPYWRSGPWNGQTFIGLRLIHNYSFYLDGMNLVDDKDGNFYLTFAATSSNGLSYFFLGSQGELTRRDWDEGKKGWNNSWSTQQTECNIYDKCGAFGACDSEKPTVCNCLRGFEPKNIGEWNRGNWTSGCTRIKPLRCERLDQGKEDGFLKMQKTKVPDFAEWSPTLVDDCKHYCLNNCSCIAYAHDPGIGCMTWSRNLFDVQKFSRGGIDLYIRLHYSEFDENNGMHRIIIITVVIGVAIIAVISFFLWKWIAKRRDMKLKSEEELGEAGPKFMSNDIDWDCKNEDKHQQIPLFKIQELAIATNNFNLSNKLGQGGFGSVYKGVLKDGHEIAVKRLSQASGQGFEEFMNEVLVISKLQHRNLVRLLGCCVEGDEKMLVYEFMPNKSLDAFIFDPTKQELLDWKKRFNIIEGISRGLLYLHRDSRLRIIHRDLKAGNILLDEEMNPKISDFGMARIFGGNENEADTRRVVGTYGYMSPEYAIGGHFSEKSDVFSFGVLLLEIVCARRNVSFCNENPLSLPGYAWKLWNEDNILTFIDNAIYDPSHHEEILRCIHVGLLCVEESMKDRPTISAVISMLNSEIQVLPNLKHPAFTERRIASDIEESPENNQSRFSINDVTVTDVEGR